MLTHSQIDERNREMHRVIARILRADPSSLNRVLERMATRLDDPGYSESLKDCLREWREIMVGDLDLVLAVLDESGEEGCRLRQNSPFAILIPQAERKRILRKYVQNEPIRAGAHPASE